MEQTQKLLQLRELIKNKKPNFIRQDSYRCKRLGRSWRAPKGYHSKLRLKIRGKGYMPSIGWSSPRSVRGLSPEGYEQVVVHNLEELKTVKGGFILGSSVGAKKRIEILRKAKELKLKVLNIKDIDSYIRSYEDKKKLKKELEKQKEEKKVKKKELPKKAEEKKEETPEEKEKREREEKRKVLESRR